MNKIGRKISKSALLNNLLEIKSRLEVEQKVCAMVKADAYGHGITTIGKILDGKVEFLGVASISEAKELIKAGVKSKIILFGVCPLQELNFLSDNNVELSIFSLRGLQEYLAKAKQNNLRLKLHIKINSGMNRFGIDSIDDYNTIQNLLINNTDYLLFRGIYTHFSTINGDDEEFIRQQRQFLYYISQTKKEFVPLIHIGGSAVLEKQLLFPFDMLRTGINLYGYQDECSVLELKTVLSIVSRVVQLHRVLPNSYIGYYPTNKVNSVRQVATIQLGYGDGIPRRLKGKLSVVINGKKVRTVGNICMDMFMCDVTNINVKEGDKVIVMDNAQEWAKILGTIPYEVLTGFSNMREF